MHIKWRHNTIHYHIYSATENPEDIIHLPIIIRIKRNENNDHLVDSIVNDLNILIESNIMESG